MALNFGIRLEQDMRRRIIWVAGFPLIPSYCATSSKSCGILRGLSRQFHIDVLVNSDRLNEESCLKGLDSFWGRCSGIQFHIVPSKSAVWRATGPIRSRFLNESRIDFSKLRVAICSLSRGEEIPVVLDDAILSRMLGTIRNPVLHSPHDCLSRLYWAEAQHSRSVRTKLEFYYRHFVVSRYERQFYCMARSVHLVNTTDEVLLKAQNPNVRTFLCPIASLLSPVESGPQVERDIDLLVWGNYRSGPVRQGALETILVLKNGEEYWRTKRVVLLGRAAFSLGATGLELCDQVSDLAKYLRRVKVCMLPDLDGAGIKNRAIDCLSQGVCLAGLRSQLGGLPTPLDYCLPGETIQNVLEQCRSALAHSRHRSLGTSGLRVFQQYLTPDRVGARFAQHFAEVYY